MNGLITEKIGMMIKKKIYIHPCADKFKIDEENFIADSPYGAGEAKSSVFSNSKASYGTDFSSPFDSPSTNVE